MTRPLLFWTVALGLTSVTAFGQTFTLAETSFKVGTVYRTYEIVFDLDKTTLNPSSYAHLDSIADFMKKNKSLVIEVGIHSESRICEQEAKMSRNLFKSRAKSVVGYLVQKGIDSERIIPIGYGCSQPLITDFQIEKMKTKEEKEKAYQINRRTEFKILRTDYQ